MPPKRTENHASVAEVELLLLKLRPKLPVRIVREVITCLRVGAERRPDPPGVFIQPRDLKNASDRDPPVQICFSFDTTGSMTSYLAKVKLEITQLVDRLVTHIPGVQISIVAHGDYGDESNYVVKAKDFSNDCDKLKRFVDDCSNTGGGDMPECYELVMYKMEELSWAATSAKALVMIGDAPPHGEEKYKGLKRRFIDWRKEAEWYAKRGIHIYGVKCGNCRESFYDQIAKITGALVIQLKDVDLMPELFTELCFREQQRWALTHVGVKEWDVRAITDPKTALLNACGSCMLQEPNFHEKVGVTKNRIRLLCKRLARDGEGEFVLKMALYCRVKLYLRSVPNFMAAIASTTPGCKEHLNTYFKHLVKLPTDMQEIAKMHVSQRYQPEHGKDVKLPSAMRKAFAKKFGDFSEYQLAKHKKTEVLCANGRWCSSQAKKNAETKDGDEVKPKGKGKGKGKRSANKPKEDAEEEHFEGPALTMKRLIRICHITTPHEMVMKVLNKSYPMNEEEFADSGLQGAFDESKTCMRMRLEVPLTFQTQLSKEGNSKESWEKLIDEKGLPFMAMLRNLRNILSANISEHHHDVLLKRLQDEKQVTQSMQMPHRFLAAYLAVDAAAKGESFGKGGGKGKNKSAVNAEINLLPPDVCERYKRALDKAVQLSAAARISDLPGKTLVFCDVSGSMRYNEFAREAKGIPGVTSAADLAILLGLLLFIRSDGPDHCCVSLFSDGSPVTLDLEKNKGVLAQFNDAKAHVGGMAKTTDFPLAFLKEKLAEFPADRIVIFSDMLIGQNRNHPGGGGKLQEVLSNHRKSTKPNCTLVCVDLFGSGATTGLDLTGDSGYGDVLLSGFSDNMLAYIANPSIGAQVIDVEKILETVQAEEEEKIKKALVRQRARRTEKANTTAEVEDDLDDDADLDIPGTD